MLLEISKLEQRYEAVLGVIRDGLDVTEVAEAYGVSRPEPPHLALPLRKGGLEGLKDRSHRPKTSPLQMPAPSEARVLELRRRRPSWGQVNTAHWVAREGVDPVPSLSAIYRALLRHKLIEPARGATASPPTNAGSGAGL